MKTRYQELRKGILSTKHLYEYIDCHAKLVSQATDRHFKEYPELLVSGEGGSQFNPVGMFANYRVSSYDEEIKVVKKWLADRLAFLDKTASTKTGSPAFKSPSRKRCSSMASQECPKAASQVEVFQICPQVEDFLSNLGGI